MKVVYACTDMTYQPISESEFNMAKSELENSVAKLYRCLATQIYGFYCVIALAILTGLVVLFNAVSGGQIQRNWKYFCMDL